ncbi:phosphoribosyltransferase-like protein [Lasiosphaeria miniovina]|uniref:adenine phosphoribosyltransferase n=1 Tax=Lasiosphaeria miniovina TaxID=1954250 RepID=A0AA40BH92_9PEZI|nr:phosphoribosyltransferase-like protein [Lasiosphaeria miniovina]KAK0734186.1 phosphoribosyltransferase-like protein [Lasiosphaeria miniovina]
MSSTADVAQNLASSSRRDQAPLTTDASGRQPPAATAGAAELASTKMSLYGALKRFPDFPIPGINFIDILPLFQDPNIHRTLLRALELQVLQFGADVAGAGNAALAKPDVIVGLDARGFLFGPSLALQLNASFVPVRKRGKMPGPCVEAAYEKEYGTDYFQMQEGAVKPGQKVLVVDDIIATGGSAAAAGSLVKQLGGDLIGYLFILEIPFLKGRDKLDGVPTVTLLETDD